MRKREWQWIGGQLIDEHGTVLKPGWARRINDELERRIDPVPEISGGDHPVGRGEADGQMSLWEE
jgi:hypothetical protein